MFLFGLFKIFFQCSGQRFTEVEGLDFAKNVEERLKHSTKYVNSLIRKKEPLGSIFLYVGNH